MWLYCSWRGGGGGGRERKEKGEEDIARNKHNGAGKKTRPLLSSCPAEAGDIADFFVFDLERCDDWVSLEKLGGCCHPALLNCIWPKTLEPANMNMVFRPLVCIHVCMYVCMYVCMHVRSTVTNDEGMNTWARGCSWFMEERQGYRC
jgi:hypothetical protein